MRSGGESGKFGNDYEESWTIHNLLQVIDDRALDLEPEPMHDGLGVEFIKTKVDGVREFHSAKVQTSGPYWSVADLMRKNAKGRSIVGDLFNKMSTDPKAEACFVSAVGANPLHLICEDARLAGSELDFQQRMSVDRDADFRNFIQPMFPDIATAKDRLSRLRAIAFNKDDLNNLIERDIRLLLRRSDNKQLVPADVRRFLGEVILGSLSRKLNKVDLLAKLQKEGYELADLARNPSVLNRIKERNNTYKVGATRFLINGNMIRRQEAQDAFVQLQSGSVNLVNHGINTVRGAAADCLASLLFSDSKRWPILEKAVHHVVFDESWSVRAVSIHCLTSMLNIDRALAVNWFVEMAGKNNALWGSIFVPRFLQFASQTHYKTLRGILLGMLASESGDARETGAQAIAIASFRVNEAFGDLVLVRAGSEDALTAWMEVAAENLRYSAFSDRCREWLKEGFFDKSPKVREIASRCFHKLSSDQLCAETTLIKSFLESPAFGHASTFLLMALEKAVDRLPDIVCRIPERALAIYRDQNDQDQLPWWTHQMSTLVLRLYNQTRNPEIRHRCLDAIDNMIALGAGEVATELEKIERV